MILFSLRFKRLLNIWLRKAAFDSDLMIRLSDSDVQRPKFHDVFWSEWSLVSSNGKRFRWGLAGDAYIVKKPGY